MHIILDEMGTYAHAQNPGLRLGFSGHDCASVRTSFHPNVISVVNVFRTCEIGVAREPGSEFAKRESLANSKTSST
jgi:hypothetical protein